MAGNAPGWGIACCILAPFHGAIQAWSIGATPSAPEMQPGKAAVNEFGFTNLAVLPIVFGLLGFVEPCSIGSTFSPLPWEQLPQATSCRT